jgi:hypothetical protein
MQIILIWHNAGPSVSHGSQNHARAKNNDTTKYIHTWLIDITMRVHIMF